MEATSVCQNANLWPFFVNHHITLLINPIYNVFNKWSSYLLPLVIRNSLSQNTSYSFFWTVRNRKLFLKLDKNMLCHNFQVLVLILPSGTEQSNSASLLAWKELSSEPCFLLEAHVPSCSKFPISCITRLSPKQSMVYPYPS